MKKSLRNLLDSFGLKISRTPGKISRQIDFHKTARPFFIDFMGPSGVGKTTLFNEVYKQRAKNIPWIIPKEFLHNRKFFISDREIPFSYQEIIELEIDKILNDNTYNSINKLKIFEFIYQNIRTEILVNSLNKNQKIVFEDGFFHVFGFEIKELVKKDFNTYQNFIQNRALIFCYTSPENLVENILKRKKTEGVRAQHQKISKEELLLQEEKTLIERRELAYFFKNLGLPFLEINTFGNLTENAKKVNDFIENLK